MRHKVKILERFYNRIINGEKKFEIRKNDRDYQVGDVLSFKVENDETSLKNYPAGWDEREFKIVYVHHGYGMDEGFVALGIVSMKESDEQH